MTEWTDKSGITRVRGDIIFGHLGKCKNCGYSWTTRSGKRECPKCRLKF